MCNGKRLVWDAWDPRYVSAKVWFLWFETLTPERKREVIADAYARRASREGA